MVKIMARVIGVIAVIGLCIYTPYHMQAPRGVLKSLTLVGLKYTKSYHTYHGYHTKEERENENVCEG